LCVVRGAWGMGHGAWCAGCGEAVLAPTHLRVDELPEERDRERAVGLDREVERPADEAAGRGGQRLAARAVEAIACGAEADGEQTWFGLGFGFGLGLGFGFGLGLGFGFGLACGVEAEGEQTEGGREAGEDGGEEDGRDAAALRCDRRESVEGLVVH